jgi:hypothetical protein
MDSEIIEWKIYLGWREDGLWTQTLRAAQYRHKREAAISEALRTKALPRDLIRKIVALETIQTWVDGIEEMEILAKKPKFNNGFP